MKKTAIATALLLASGAAHAAPVDWTGSFSMYDPSNTQMDANGPAAGLDAYVTGQIDTDAGVYSLASTDPFSGLQWTATNGILFGEGTHTVSTADAGCGFAICASGSDITFTVGAGQLGGVIKFGWGATGGIDVVNVWDVSGNTYTSTDVDGDGILGLGMVDGPFPGFNANFNMTTSEVPVPAAVWLFGSGLVGLAGIARRRKAA